MDFKQRNELITELHNRGFEDGPLNNTGWNFKRFTDGTSVWFNSTGRFIVRLSGDDHNGVASEPAHILNLINETEV